MNTIVRTVALLAVFWTAAVVSQAADGKKPHVVFVVGGGEYGANKTMPVVARELQDKHGCRCTVLEGKGKDADYQIAGLEALKDADLMVLFLRRRALPKDQLDAIRAYLDAGKPLVAFRTASHGFDVATPPKDRVTWPTFDIDVLGCDYRGHGRDGTDVTVDEKNATHPILAGVETAKWTSAGSLYGEGTKDKDATILLFGSQDKTTNPVAWTRTYKGGRVFYTSLGHEKDFEQPAFRKLVVNAIAWAMDRPLPR